MPRPRKLSAASTMIAFAKPIEEWTNSGETQFGRIDRRMMYALEGIGMLRHGEAAGLRWRHYEPDADPLGRLTIATSYDKGRTKTKHTRYVPVHETLAVRGERLAAARLVVDYEIGFVLEAIQMLQLDATVTQVERAFDFDVDDLDSVIAELDRLHSRADAS